MNGVALSTFLIILRSSWSIDAFSPSSQPFVVHRAEQPLRRRANGFVRCQPMGRCAANRPASMLFYRGRQEWKPFNEHGHYYTRSGGPIDPSVCELTEQEIHSMIVERMLRRRARDYQGADKMREELQAAGIHLNDKSKTWRAISTKGPGRRSSKHSANKIPRFTSCDTMEEAVQKACHHLDSLSHRSMAAFWTEFSRFLVKNKARKRPMSPKLLRCLSSILNRTIEEVESFGSRYLTQLTLALCKIVSIIDAGSRARVHSKGGFHESLHVIFVDQKDVIVKSTSAAANECLEKFDARHLSNLAYAYALIAESIPEDAGMTTLFHQIGERSVNTIGSFNSQDTANIVWAFAKAGVLHPQLFEVVAKRMINSNFVDEFKAQELSNIAWSYAKADASCHDLFEKVASRIISSKIIDDLSPQGLSNIAWAFATAEVSHPELFERIAETILASHNINRFKPQVLSNVAWAYAKSETSRSDLFESIAQVIVESKTLDRFQPQGLSNVLWSFAKSEVAHPELFKRVADHIVSMEQIQSFSPQALANTVWSLAKSEVSHPEVFARISHTILQSDGFDTRFKPNDLSDISWAYAKSEVSSPELYEKVADSILSHDNLHEFKQQDLATILWSFAKAEELSALEPLPRLFDECADVIISSINTDEYNPRHISSIVWAYASAEVPEPELFQAAADYIIELGHEGVLKLTSTESEDDASPLSDLLWAFGKSHPHLCRKVTAHIDALIT